MPIRITVDTSCDELAALLRGLGYDIVASTTAEAKITRRRSDALDDGSYPFWEIVGVITNGAMVSSNDLAALTDLLLRIGALADDLPHVAELDCNPVVALPSGALIVDARVRVEAAELPPPLGARR